MERTVEKTNGAPLTGICQIGACALNMNFHFSRFNAGDFHTKGSCFMLYLTTSEFNILCFIMSYHHYIYMYIRRFCNIWSDFYSSNKKWKSRGHISRISLKSFRTRLRDSCPSQLKMASVTLRQIVLICGSS